MLKVGEYKTKGGHTAHIVFVGKDGGGAGYVSINGTTYTSAWNLDGFRHGRYADSSWNLNLSPPTITIPETVLPKPTKTAPGYGELCFGVICHHAGWCVLNAEWRGRAEDMELLSAGCVHTSDKAAQQWADFFNKYMANK